METREPRQPEPIDRESAIVAAVRRIMRAVDLHSRRLFEEHGLTGPQLATLSAIGSAGSLSPAEIAERVHLSRGTVTGILGRLERQELVERRPSAEDRRSVNISLTERGSGLLDRAPSLLQEEFRGKLSRLEDWEQLQILATLQRIASMMDASDLDASPHLVTSIEDLASGGAVPSLGAAAASAAAAGSPSSPPGPHVDHPGPSRVEVPGPDRLEHPRPNTLGTPSPSHLDHPSPSRFDPPAGEEPEPGGGRRR